MLKIKGTLVSLDLIDENFTCDLDRCKGACCVQGESGAPLQEEEVEILERIYPDIKNFLRPEVREFIEKYGTSYYDADREPVTQLNNGKECVFTVFENGIARCGIEKAFEAGKTDFRKPVSCHLYPIRIRKFKDFQAVNYDKWEICHPAIEKGNRLQMPVYRFTGQSLIRRFGITWYDEFNEAAEAYRKEKIKTG